ncbi:MAG TPA: hypothetical protein VFK06_06135, partial [Candidatus Angelobacter sp.]|nr:hypothetical protein [Candidatus Angelobacter sp.]
KTYDTRRERQISIIEAHMKMITQILSHMIEEDRVRGVAQPMRGDLPYPEGSTPTFADFGALKIFCVILL